MTEARRTPAEREALRVQVIAERRRRQRSRWMLAGASAGAVTSASLLGLVSVAWWNGQHQPAPRPQAILERRIVTTTRVVRPKPRVKVIRVVRAAPQSGMTFASSASTASSPTQAAATAPAYVQPSSGYSAPAAPSAPPAQTHVQTVTPSAPPPPPVTTHAS